MDYKLLKLKEKTMEILGQNSNPEHKVTIHPNPTAAQPHVPASAQPHVPAPIQSDARPLNISITWNGRSITDKRSSITIKCLSLSGLFLCLLGGILWGVCKNPKIDGCNLATQLAGRALVWSGVSLFGISCCGRIRQKCKH